VLILRDVAGAAEACRNAARRGSLGLVPTMGALHAGHAALVRRARAENDTVAVSIFVNPLQFEDAADLQRYPRTEAADAALLEAAGCDLLLLLPRESMYPPGFATRIDQPALSGLLEGASRPGHFAGVLTVVAKLLVLAAPARSYFGRKDFQQTVLVRRLVADLGLPLEVVVCDTVRDADGLALSSRNVFLSPADRQRGLSLVRALAAAEADFEAGQRDGAALVALMERVLRAGLSGPPDYVALVDPDDLSPRAIARLGDVAVLAARLGQVRLIDNHVLGGRIGPLAPRS
jgi:pantoate--beta-alanine ligase